MYTSVYYNRHKYVKYIVCIVFVKYMYVYIYIYTILIYIYV